MWNAIKRLFGFDVPVKPEYLASDKAFRELDVDRIKRRMRLEVRGRTRGSRDRPLTGATDLDDVEQEIQRVVDEALKESLNNFSENENAYSSRLSDLNIDNRSSEIRTVAASARADLEAEYHKGRDNLRSLRRRVLDISDEFDEFKDRNDIQRSANYPDSKLLQRAILAAMLLGESVANASLLGQGHELGLIGGWTVAIIIAGVNVLLLGVVGGASMRWANHMSPPKKLAGILGLVAFLVGACVVNLMGAHVRGAYQNAETQDPFAVAAQTFAESPLALGDALSWLLVIIGIAFAVAAAIDIYKMDDPYPGFGEIDRRLHEAEDDYVAEKNDLIERMESIRDWGVDQMRDEQKGLQTNLVEFKEIHGHRNALRREFSSHVNGLKRDLSTLVNAYRDANRSRRSTKEPAYFSKPVELDYPSVPGPAVIVDEAEMAATVKEIGSVLEDGINVVQRLYVGSITKYNGIDELTKQDFERGAASSEDTVSTPTGEINSEPAASALIAREGPGGSGEEGDIGEVGEESGHIASLPPENDSNRAPNPSGESKYAGEAETENDEGVTDSSEEPKPAGSRG